jgi:type I restriction enzyme S subunit
MSFPRYPAYKPSGVEWLGEVPEHWEVKRVRRIFEIKKRIAGELGFDILSITQQGIKVRDPDSNDGQISMDYSKYQMVEPGDFAMNHMDLLTGYVDISKRLGVTSPDYRVFSVVDPSDSDLGYLLYVFQMGYRQKILYAYGQGSSQLGRWRLPTAEFQNWAIPFPSLKEQVSIATFLDHETAKIDALIAEQQRLIELLQEKRQAVISHVVTKGLNPHAPMKDSGVEWLGEVPEHWEILELKRLIKEGSSITYGIVQAGPHIDDGVPYIRTSDMAGDRLILETCQRTSMEIDESYARSKVEAGDLVIAIRATVGKVLEVPIELHGANLTQGTAKFSPGARVDARFIKASFEADYCQSQIMSSAKGATFLEITLDALRRLKIAIPPRHEQEEVVEFLAGATSRLGDLLLAAQQTITLLQERRSALISAAVTGQIDVRGLVPVAEAA